MSTALARVKDVDANAWMVMREQAQVLCKTGFLPEAIKTPEQAMAIMMKGRELGIPPMYALSNISVIKGKPVCSAELMAAVIYRDHGDAALKIVHTDNQACTLTYKRRQWTEEGVFTFTIEDARKADLLINPTWRRYPQAMLRARCISAVARAAFQDSIGGMYTPEELGAAVQVTDDGAVEVIQNEEVPDLQGYDQPPPKAQRRQPVEKPTAPPVGFMTDQQKQDIADAAFLLWDTGWKAELKALAEHVRPGKPMAQFTRDEAQQLLDELQQRIEAESEEPQPQTTVEMLDVNPPPETPQDAGTPMQALMDWCKTKGFCVNADGEPVPAHILNALKKDGFKGAVTATNYGTAQKLLERHYTTNGTTAESQAAYAAALAEDDSSEADVFEDGDE